MTRGLLKLLELPPFQATVDCLPVRTEPVRWHRLTQVRSLLRSSISKLPAKADFLYSKAFGEKVSARVRSQCYDLVILNGADLLWITEFLPESIPRILVAHNIEHRLFRLQTQYLGWSRWPFKAFLRADCQRLENYELNGMRETGNVVFLSAEEAADAQTLCKDLRAITVPPLFDYEPVIRQPKKLGPTLEIGLLGNFGWWPNQLGLRWFLEKVLPHVKSSVRLNLFGRSAGRRWTGDPRIVERGVVEQIEHVWESCDFLICPTFSTGGVCVKLAEAVYNRMPVLATRHAARGLPIGEDPALMFLDEPHEWIEFLNSAGARRLAESQVADALSARFGIDAHKDRVKHFVHEAISRGTGVIHA